MAWIAAAAAIGGALISSNASQSAADTQANAANNAQQTQLQMFNTVNQQQAPYRQAGQTALNDILYGYGLGASPDSINAATNNGPPGAKWGWLNGTDQSGGAGWILPDGSTMSANQWAQQNPNAPAPTTSNQGFGSGYFGHQFNADDLNSNLAPNYAFQLNQGLGATRNAANLQGGLVNGNTLKGINDYAQNFAGNAYQQAYNNYTANQSNIFNRLSTIAGLGSAANQQSSQAGQAFASNIGSAQLAQGAAQAAGTIGSANALSGGINNAFGWYATRPQTGSNGFTGNDSPYIGAGADQYQFLGSSGG